jgi:hypothetical protein
MKRAVLLLVVLASTLSSAYLLPDFRLVESAIRMEVPSFLEGWSNETYVASERERATLAKDTRFSKAVCLRPRWSSAALLGAGAKDRADLSIVLSGHDLANSIHRPERCMPAQGHKIYDSKSTTVEVPGARAIPVRRLLSTQEITLGEKGETTASLDSLTCYFFVGHHSITDNHTRRTLIDISDRLFKGEAQRWAYVSVTMWFDGEHTPDELAREAGLPGVDAAEESVRHLLAELAAKNIDWEMIDR